MWYIRSCTLLDPLSRCSCRRHLLRRWFPFIGWRSFDLDLSALSSTVPDGFLRSCFKVSSNIEMYFFKVNCDTSDLRPAPSSEAIRAFISCLSISQALRSRSCRCHSVWRNRMTPVHVSYVCGRARPTHLVAYTRCPVVDQIEPHLHHYLRHCSTASPSEIGSSYHLRFHSLSHST